METYYFGIFPLWLILLLLVIAFFLAVRFRSKHFFNEIKEIVNSKKTGSSDLYAAVDAMNGISKGKLSIDDYVDVKLDGNDYKLIRGSFSSIAAASEYGLTMTVLSGSYICALDKASLENAKWINDLLRLSVQHENAGVFLIRNIRKLKNRVKKEACPQDEK